MHRRQWFGLGILLMGCNDASAPSLPPPTFAVSPAAQWAGGTILVRSQFFSGRDSLPAVTAADIEMVVTRIDDSTLAATLPSFSSQAAPIEVVDGGVHYLIDTVRVAGFRSHRVSNPVVAVPEEPVLIQAAGGPFGISKVFPQPPGGAVGLVVLATGRTIVASGVTPIVGWPR